MAILVTLSSRLHNLAVVWTDTKLFLEQVVAFSQDSLHVIASVLIQLVAALLLRRSISSWWPWLVVFAAAAINESADLWIDQWPEPAVQYGEGVRDLLLTMLLPTLLLITSRIFPSLYRSTRSPVRGQRKSQE